LMDVIADGLKTLKQGRFQNLSLLYSHRSQ
jgi:hypothetical protein